MDRPATLADRAAARQNRAFAGAPVLVALAFLLVSAVDLPGAGLATVGRETGPARAAARPLSGALIRVVRGIVGIQNQRPVPREASRPPRRGDRLACVAVADSAPEAAPWHHVREALLNLPPPAARA